MPKKKAKHRKSKHRPHLMAHHGAEHETHGHHARLRKHHHSGSGGHHAAHGHGKSHHHKAAKKAPSRAKVARKRSALMERLHAAAAGAREQLSHFGRRRKNHQSEKPVTEQTLRHHMALKCVRRCSH